MFSSSISIQIGSIQYLFLKMRAKVPIPAPKSIQFLTYLNENRTEAGRKYNESFFQPPARVESLLKELKRIKELESQ